MPGLVEIGPVVLEKKTFEFCQCIFAISYLSHLFEQTLVPFTQGCSVSCLVEIGPVVLEKKIFKLRQYN